MSKINKGSFGMSWYLDICSMEYSVALENSMMTTFEPLIYFYHIDCIWTLRYLHVGTNPKI